MPVNPHAETVFGLEAFDSLAAAPDGIDLVDVFRPAREVPGIVEETLERENIETVWLQLGIVHDKAAQRAEAAGIEVVQDRCMKVEHKRLLG